MMRSLKTMMASLLGSLVLSMSGVCCADDTLFTEAGVESVYSVRVFPELLLPVSATNEAENLELAALLQAAFPSAALSSIEPLITWAELHPESPWAVPLYYNVGHWYYKEGFYTRAINSWQNGWSIGKDLTSNNGIKYADACFGQLAKMHARLGRMQELDSLFDESTSRSLTSPGKIQADHARDALWTMKSLPGDAFKCGPFALAEVRETKGLTPKLPSLIVDAKSTATGFSLSQIGDLASQLSMNMVPVQLADETVEYPVPSVVHWKSGHYAALLGTAEGKYHIKDVTFGTDTYISRTAMEEEISGFFLADASTVGSSIELVEAQLASQIFGRGLQNTVDAKAYSVQDQHAKPYSANCGMAGYNFLSLLASLTITDTPIGYSPPVGPSVYFTLRYVQRDNTGVVMPGFTHFGPHWNFSFDSQIVESADLSKPPSLTLFSEMGGESIYSLESTTGNTYTSSFSTDKIEIIEPGASRYYEVRFADGSKDVYRKIVGRYSLKQRFDPQGNALTFNYDLTNGRLETIEDAVGQPTTLKYGSADEYRVTSIEDPFDIDQTSKRRRAVFAYQDGILTEIKDVIGIASKFTYGTGSFISELTTPYGTTRFSTEPESSIGNVRWVQATDQYGESEKVAFYPINPKIPSTMAMDSGKEVPQEINGLKVVNQYLQYRNSCYWDKRAMRASPDNPNGSVITHFLHGKNGSVSRVVESEKRPLQFRQVYNYKGQTNPSFEGPSSLVSHVGRVVKNDITEYKTQVTQLEYNNVGRPTLITDPVGRVTKMIYEANDVDLKEVQQLQGGSFKTIGKITYNSKHLPQTVTDTSGQVTSYLYNSKGKVREITNPNLDKLYFSYKRRNNSNAFVSDPEGAFLHRAWSSGTNAYTEFYYDNPIGTSAKEYTNQVSRILTSPDQYEVSFSYDALDRVTQVTYPGQRTEKTVYDKLDIVATQDLAGQWTQYRYNSLRQLEGMTNPAGETTQLHWCSCGSLSRLVDPEGRITAWEYDAQGRQIKKIMPDGTATQNYFNFDGRLWAAIDSRSQATLFSYFTDNNVKNIQYYGTQPDVKQVPAESFTYDPDFNRLKTRSDSEGLTTYHYNPIVADTNYGDNRLQSCVGPWSNSNIEYVYDKLGRVKNKTVAGNIETYQYDNMGRFYNKTNLLDSLFEYVYVPDTYRLFSTSSNQGPDRQFGYLGITDDNRLQQVTYSGNSGTPSLSSFSYGYDVLGRITNWNALVNGVLHTQGAKYDNSNRLLELVRNAPAGTGSQWNYRYDKNGNRLNDQHEQWTANNSTLQRQQYAINNLDQITGYSPGGPLHVIATISGQAKVTQAGAITPALTGSQNTVSTWVSSSAQGQGQISMQHWNGTSGSGTANPTAQVSHTQTPLVGLQYDSNGNMTQALVTVGGMQITAKYEWDHKNQLVAIEFVNMARTEFSYDGFGRRVRIVEKTYQNGQFSAVSDKYFLWDGLRIVQERASKGGSPSKVFFADGEVHLPSNKRYYYITDHLGSTREVIDELGQIVARYDYDPYGTPTVLLELVQFDLLYTGHYYHRNSGLYLAPYRAYNPMLGRWLSREPLGFDGPNLHHYGYNSPLNNLDSSGLFTESIGNFYNSYGPGALWNKLVTKVDNAISPTIGDYIDPLAGLADNNNNTYEALGSATRQDFAGTKKDVSRATAEIACTAAASLLGYAQFGNKLQIKWGAQEKHFPGHNNWDKLKRRSPMTADPEKLLSFAGSGTPMNNLPVGSPGSKELVNFGSDIGEYIDGTGVNHGPTQNGIIHYPCSGPR